MRDSPLQPSHRKRSNCPQEGTAHVRRTAPIWIPPIPADPDTRRAGARAGAWGRAPAGARAEEYAKSCAAAGARWDGTGMQPPPFFLLLPSLPVLGRCGCRNVRIRVGGGFWSRPWSGFMRGVYFDEKRFVIFLSQFILPIFKTFESLFLEILHVVRIYLKVFIGF